VDGILGMSFLRGTRFLFDPAASRIVWWGYHFSPGLTVPLSESSGALWLDLRLGTQRVLAMVDTGMSGGIDLPADLLPKGDSTGSVSGGLFGTMISGAVMRVKRLDAGTSAWMDVPVSFQGEGQAGGVGAEVWNAAPVCFDFITNHLTFSLDASGNLPFVRESRRSLPLAWDRSGSLPRLSVLLVKPGSAMERAGCQPGDELVQVGDMQGAKLTRRSIQDLVASGIRHDWIVRRKGQVMKLEFAPTQK